MRTNHWLTVSASVWEEVEGRQPVSDSLEKKQKFNIAHSFSLESAMGQSENKSWNWEGFCRFSFAGGCYSNKIRCGDCARRVWALSCIPPKSNKTNPSTEEKLLELESKLGRTGTIEQKEKVQLNVGRKANMETFYINTTF